MEVEVLEKKSLSSLYSEVTFIQGQVKANLEMQKQIDEFSKPKRKTKTADKYQKDAEFND